MNPVLARRSIRRFTDRPLEESDLQALLAAALAAPSAHHQSPAHFLVATENLLVEATARGLGSCWLGVYPKAPLMEACRLWGDLPEEVLPFALVALGWPGETKTPHPDRPDPARIRRETWGA